MKLVWPSLEHLPSYRSALAQGWSADNTRPQAAAEELAEVDADPVAFLAGLVSRDPQGLTVTLPDGSKVPRLPGFRRWLWDGEFCGAIGFRWQPGTHALPPHCLGHIGYAIVPWKQRRGYATRALALLLPEARAEGMAYVEITTDPQNIASQRVIEANGGAVVRAVRQAGPVRQHSRLALQSAAVVGARSNPSIERTLQRPLRALWPAAHVER